MDRIIKMIMEKLEAEEGGEELKTPVGEMDEELLAAHKEMVKQRRFLKDRLELKMKELELEFKRRADEEIGPLQEEINQVHEDFWQQVYEKNNLPNEKDQGFHYRVSPKEKKIYKIVKY